MFLILSCSFLCLIHWSQILSRWWRCSWSSADRQCSKYIWVISKFIAYYGAFYIRGLPVLMLSFNQIWPVLHLCVDFVYPPFSFIFHCCMVLSGWPRILSFQDQVPIGFIYGCPMFKWLVRLGLINSLWPSDTIWRQRSGSTLAQVMACCLTTPSHYLNQSWLNIS